MKLVPNTTTTKRPTTTTTMKTTTETPESSALKIGEYLGIDTMIGQCQYSCKETGGCSTKLLVENINSAWYVSLSMTKHTNVA